MADNIDLADPATLNSIVNQALADDSGSGSISVSFDGKNVARVSNQVVAIADSGNNSVNTPNGTALINTGNAYAIASLLNRVNTTIINSKIYLLTLNIFGTVSGNIILPELSAANPNNNAVTDVTVNNQATSSNQIAAAANTGNNTATVSGTAAITTGNAATAVNVANMVNTTLINTNFTYLVINTIGQWLGQFLGLNGPSGSNIAAGPGGQAAIDNQANVTNNITVAANTGNNSILGKNGSITTGNAYAVVSLFNFINSTIINSNGFWGFINIFGRLNGNIGGASQFLPAAIDNPSSTGNNQSTSASNSSARETGGQLAITQTNNVGDYVLPGDTVTFNINVKNTGSGRVDDVRLYLGLTQDGNDIGGGWLNLGSINPGKGVKVSTGIPLPKDFESGNYTAVARAVGLIGPGDTEISAEADSNLTVRGATRLVDTGQSLAAPVEAQIQDSGIVLGATTPPVDPYTKILDIFKSLVFLLLAMKGVQNRGRLALGLSSLMALLKSG